MFKAVDDLCSHFRGVEPRTTISSQFKTLSQDECAPTETRELFYKVAGMSRPMFRFELLIWDDVPKKTVLYIRDGDTDEILYVMRNVEKEFIVVFHTNSGGCVTEVNFDSRKEYQ